MSTMYAVSVLYTLKHIYTHIYTNTHTCINTLKSCTQMCSKHVIEHTCPKHVHTPSYTLIHPHPHPHTHTQTQTHARTHTYTISGVRIFIETSLTLTFKSTVIVNTDLVTICTAFAAFINICTQVAHML